MAHPYSGTNMPPVEHPGNQWFRDKIALQDVILEGTPLQSQEVIFDESDGSAAGTYAGSVTVPAGATIVDIIVEGTALWDADTSATMIVGDADDDDGYFTGVNLKATDLLADQTLSFANTGGVEGAYLTGTVATDSDTHWTNRYSASARVITGSVTTVGTVGSAGRTRMTVVYSKPEASKIVTADFTAT